jgi:hypothetical protein
MNLQKIKSLQNYYSNLIGNTKNPEHLKHYKKMLENLSENKQAKPKIIKNYKTKNYLGYEAERKKGKTSVYIGSLDKTFDSLRKASFALGKNKNYVSNVLLGKLDNKYNIELKKQ